MSKPSKERVWKEILKDYSAMGEDGSFNEAFSKIKKILKEAVESQMDWESYYEDAIDESYQEIEDIIMNIILDDTEKTKLREKIIKYYCGKNSELLNTLRIYGVD